RLGGRRHDPGRQGRRLLRAGRRLHPLGSERRHEDLRLQLSGDQGVDPAGAHRKTHLERGDREIENVQASVQSQVRNEQLEASSYKLPASGNDVGRTLWARPWGGPFGPAPQMSFRALKLEARSPKLRVL